MYTHSFSQKNEDPALRLSVLQALHGAIKVAGPRMSDKHKTEILATLLTLYSTAQVQMNTIITTWKYIRA